MQSKSQRYSSAVFPLVQEVASQQQQNRVENDAFAKKCKGLCKRAGSLIRTVGLAQAFAFFEAKGEREPQHHRFTLHIHQELNELQLITPHNHHPNVAWLNERIRALNLPAYMTLTREILQLCNWHKRLAETLIEGTDKED